MAEIFDVRSVCLSPEARLRDAMECIERTQQGIALVVDTEGRLLDTITDGDLRRAMLSGIAIDTGVSQLRDRRADSPFPVPVTAPEGTPEADLLALLRESRLRQIPLVDREHRVVGLATLDELAPAALPLQALVMAGGYGSRLHPLTESTPKPLLPVGGRPLMEHILEQLQQAGIRRVNVATHYRGNQIVEHFGSGEAFGVELQYVNEDRPLGTAGAVGLLGQSTDPILVVNGDIVTKVDYRAMLVYHQEHRADLTVAVRRFDVQVPYGVVDCDGAVVRGIREKPSLGFFVNAGIYLLEPTVHGLIPRDERFDMTDLIHRLLERRSRVAGFLVHEYWRDIGQHDDYARVQQETAAWRGQK